MSIDSRYTITNNTGKGLYGYSDPSGAGKPLVNKLPDKGTADGDTVLNNFLNCFFKNQWGWIELVKDVKLVDRGAPLPPVDPPPIPIPTGKVWDIDLKVPTSGEWYRVLHDAERASKYKPRQLWGSFQQPNKAMPATRALWGCKPDDFIPFNEAWQYFMLDVLNWATNYKLPRGDFEYWFTVQADVETRVSKEGPGVRAKYTYGSLLWAWEDYTCDNKAHTDGHSVQDGFRDHVLHRNMNAKDIAFKCLAMTGEIMQGVGVATKYRVFNALNPYKPPPTLQSALDNLLIQWNTQQTVDQLPKLNGKLRWVVSRWPQLKLACLANGLPDVGTPHLIIGKDGVNTILKTDIAYIANEKSYSPYVPEK